MYQYWRECDYVSNRIGKYNLNIHQHKLMLTESRGVGTVARTYHEAVLEVCDKEKTGGKDIFFYPFFQQVPLAKMPNSVVLVHDLIVIKDEEFRYIKEKYEADMRNACDIVSHIVAVSNTVKHDLIDLFGIAESKISVVENPIDLIPSECTGNIELPKRPYVVFLGAGNKTKNIDILLRAFLLLKDDDVDLVMLGNCRNYQHIVEAMKLDHRIHFHGRLTGNDLGYVVKNACALVHPSRIEGFGLTPFEAALLGVSSIIADKPALNEVVRPHEAIFLAYDDPKAWAHEIRQAPLKLFPKEALSSFQSRIKNELTREACLDKLLQVFNKL